VVRGLAASPEFPGRCLKAYVKDETDQRFSGITRREKA